MDCSPGCITYNKKILNRGSLSITDKVKNISVSTLILVRGEKEYPLTDLSAAQPLDEVFDDSELRNVPDSGHFMFAEKATEF